MGLCKHVESDLKSQQSSIKVVIEMVGISSTAQQGVAIDMLDEFVSFIKKMFWLDVRPTSRLRHRLGHFGHGEVAAGVPSHQDHLS